MDNFPLNGEIRAEIRKKLDEHIRQILDKPTISVEEHDLLERVDRLYADTGRKDNSWFFILLFLIFSGFGGDKNAL